MFLRRNNRRVILIDELRGLCILLMVVYHAFFNLVHIFGVNISAFHAPFLQSFLQPLVAGIFVMISGIVSRYSRSCLKRGVLVFLCGMAITAATFFFMPGQLILFGILHLLGLCMIIQGIISKSAGVTRPDRFPALPGALIFLAIFFATYDVPRGYLGFMGRAFSIRLPEVLYTNIWLSPLGFPGGGFSSMDYFPIIPWMFLFFAGSCLSTTFQSGAMPEFFYKNHCRFLSATGRHTLIIYLLHQPILYGLFWSVWQIRDIIGN